MPTIAGVVILYNPESSIIRNIDSYINQVNKLYVIDNSDESNDEIVKKLFKLEKVEYVWNGANLGIAAALNIGASKAIVGGFDYLLTMDQDSEATPSMVSKLLGCFSDDSKIAIVAPLLKHSSGRNFIPKSDKSCEQVFTVWTSGNLIDLSIFKLTDGFLEDLFIDYVDHEFCLRLNKMGYKIYICNNTFLIHNLGKTEEVNLIFRKVHPTNHSALRLYYRARNRFYVKKLYQNQFPDFFRQDDRDFWRSFFKVILFEKQKIKKIKYFTLGYKDFRKNKFGKFEINYSINQGK